MVETVVTKALIAATKVTMQMDYKTDMPHLCPHTVSATPYISGAGIKPRILTKVV